MSLEASHIRFALDLKEKLGVLDVQKYIVGAIYPDSRYINGIDRVLTHPENFLDDEFFMRDDFKKGWYTHLLCDQLCRQIAREKVSEAFEGPSGQGGEHWIRHTALKIIQDIVDAKSFPIVDYLPLLDYVENPNGEDMSVLKRYNSISQETYKNPDVISINDVCNMLRAFGIGEDIVLRVNQWAETYSADERIASIARTIIYPEALEKARRI